METAQKLDLGLRIALHYVMTRVRYSEQLSASGCKERVCLDNLVRTFATHKVSITVLRCYGELLHVEELSFRAKCALREVWVAEGHQLQNI